MLALDGDGALQNRFVERLRGITSAVSPEPVRRYGHLRRSTGIEDPDDLVADIAQALDAATR